MVSTTIQITEDVQGKLYELAEQEHESVETIIALAVERNRREWMLERANDIYAIMTPRGVGRRRSRNCPLGRNPHGWSRRRRVRVLSASTLHARWK